MIRPVLFVNRQSDSNLGDQLSTPHRYFRRAYPGSLGVEVHLPRGKGVARLKRFLLRNLRDNASTIVVGGGGLIGNAFFERDLEFWTKASVPLVLWGAGHNSHDTAQVQATPPSAPEYAQLVPFALVGVRDWGVGYTWAPCASCMDPDLDLPTNSDGSTLFVVHRDLKADPDALKAMLARSPGDHRVVFNDASKAEFFGALAQARQVVTNSYHAAYWATLMAKPVVAIGGGTKVARLKHAVPLGTPDNWAELMKDAPVHPTAKEECRDATQSFSNRVRALVDLRRSETSSRPFRPNPAADRDADAAAMGVPLPAVVRKRAPKVVHFVFGLSPTFGGKPFNIMHSIAVRSVAERFKPDAIILHHQYEPDNEFYHRVRPLITPRHVVAPDSYGDRPVTHFAHKADIIRLQALRDEGGVYLDLDTITVASLDPLLDHSFSIGLQGLSPVEGLCNAVMAAAPGDPFVENWLKHYETFSGDAWDRYSVKLPHVMWRSGKHSINVMAPDRFHWPLWSEAGLKMMFEEEHEFPNALCHHLWESYSFPRYFADETYAEAVKRVRSMRSTYARLAAPYLD